MYFMRMRRGEGTKSFSLFKHSTLTNRGGGEEGRSALWTARLDLHQGVVDFLGTLDPEVAPRLLLQTTNDLLEEGALVTLQAVETGLKLKKELNNKTCGSLEGIISGFDFQSFTGILSTPIWHPFIAHLHCPLLINCTLDCRFCRISLPFQTYSLTPQPPSSSYH